MKNPYADEIVEVQVIELEADRDRLAAKVDALRKAAKSGGRTGKRLRFGLSFLAAAGVTSAVLGGFLSFLSGSAEKAKSKMRWALDRHDTLVVMESDQVGPQTRCALEMAYAEDNRHCSARLACEGRTLYDGSGSCRPYPRRDTSGGLLYHDADLATGGGRLAVSYAADFRVALRSPEGRSVLTALAEYEGEVAKVDAQASAFELTDGRRVVVTDQTQFADGDAGSLEEIAGLLGGSGRVRVVVATVYDQHRGQRVQRARTLRVKRLD